MLDPVEENNSNQGNMKEQEDKPEVDVESPNMISVFDVVNYLPAHWQWHHCKLEFIAKDGN